MSHTGHGYNNIPASSGQAQAHGPAAQQWTHGQAPYIPVGYSNFGQGCWGPANTPFPGWTGQPFFGTPLWLAPTRPRKGTSGHPKRTQSNKARGNGANKVSKTVSSAIPTPHVSAKGRAATVRNDSNEGPRPKHDKRSNTDKGTRNKHDTFLSTKQILFDDVEWHKHRKIAEMAFELMQLDFHLNSWNSETPTDVEERRTDYFNSVTSPKPDLALKSDLEVLNTYVRRETQQLMIKHLRSQHNKIVTELREFVTRSTINTEPLDKAMSVVKLKNLKKWKVHSFDCLWSDVKQFCINGTESKIIMKFTIPVSPNGVVQTGPPIGESPKYQVDFVGQADEPTKKLPVVPVGKRTRDKELATPPHNSDRPPSPMLIDEIDDIGAILSEKNSEIDWDDDNSRSYLSDMIDTLFRAIIALVNSSSKPPELKKFIWTLCKLTLNTELIPIPQEMTDIIGPNIMGELASCEPFPSGLSDTDLGNAAAVIATALSLPDFVNTPKAHRKRKIHSAFSKAFGREKWWRQIESSFPFLRKKA